MLADWRQQPKKDAFWNISYSSKLVRWTIVPTDCYEVASSHLEYDKDLIKKPPLEMIEELKKRASTLESTPLAAYGIKFPKNASVNIYVTKLDVELLLLSQVMQAVMLPVLVLWLGSLYATRFREVFFIFKAQTLAQVFPHIINVYGTISTPTIRKRNILAPYAGNVISVYCTFLRIGLLSIFIGPPVALYLYSLYLGASNEFVWLYLVAGGAVAIFSMMNFVAELLPAHAKKVFLDPMQRLSMYE